MRTHRRLRAVDARVDRTGDDDQHAGDDQEPCEGSHGSPRALRALRVAADRA